MALNCLVVLGILPSHATILILSRLMAHKLIGRGCNCLPLPSHVLEHVPLLRDCHNLLQQGGILVIAVPNDCGCMLAKLRFGGDRLRPLEKRCFCAAGFERILLDGCQREVHLSHFSLPVLRQLLKNRGYSMLEESLDPYYVAGGFMLMCHHFFYAVSMIVWRIFKINIYPTIWIVAKRD